VRIPGRFAPILRTILCGAACLASASALAAENSSGNGISSFGVGGGLVMPVGNQYVTLGNAGQYAGDVYITQQGLGPDTPLRFTGMYVPFAVKNIPNASANLGIIGVLGGIEFHAPGSAGRVAPYFGAQIGAGYEFLTFPGASNNSQNATIAFAARILPGIELPFSQSVSFMVEVPVMALVAKSTNVIGGTAGMLRFHL
jgi:hypothetical protein